MGGIFSRRKGKIRTDGSDGPVVAITKMEEISEEVRSDLEKWEKKLHSINEKSLEQFKSDFIDRERDTISKLIRDKEIEYNDQLAPYRRRIQFVGSHEDVSASHILYKPLGVDYYERTGVRQIYVLHDNVQLFHENEFEQLQSVEYTEMDGGPNYRLCVEPSVRHLGYARLRCVDIIPGVSRNNTYEDIYKKLNPIGNDEPDILMDSRPILYSSDNTNGRPFTGTVTSNRLTERRPSGVLPQAFQVDLRSDMNKIVEKAKNGKIKPPSSRSLKMTMDANDDAFKVLKKKLEGIDEDEEDEDENNDKSIEIESDENETTPSIESLSDNDKPDLHSTINKECFICKRLRIKSKDDHYNLGRSDEEEDRRLYLSSERFRETVEDSFPEFLKAVQKSHLDENVKVEEPAIIVEELYKQAMMYKTEYYSGIAYSEWPECANEWIFRARNERVDNLTKMMFRWPKQRHIHEIHQQHGCTIIPIGYHNPIDRNRIMLIEWQYQFVRAEQILLRSLGHQQIRVLLMVQLLFRDHVEKDDTRIIKPQHLRYILFWLCEHNYRDWHDDRLAMKIKAFLKTLYNALSSGQLPHYFMHNVNLLDNIKLSKIRTVQEAVKRISENLPMYLLHTIKRLRCKRDFYPLVNFKELYEFLKVKRYGVEQLNPALTGAINEDEEEKEEYDDSDQEKDSEETKILKRRLHAERQRRHSVYLEKTGKKKVMQQKVKTNGIDLNIHIKKLNDRRAEGLLRLFSEQFINFAICSNKFGAHPQAMKYLYYAENLLNILLDEDMKCPLIMEEELEDLQERIKTERKNTRQGLNYMLNYTHKMTKTFDIKVSHVPPKHKITKTSEIKVSHVPPRTNWELKKPQNQHKPSTSSIKLKSTRQSEFTTQEPPIKGVKIFPGKKEQEKSLVKSLPDVKIEVPESIQEDVVAEENAPEKKYLTFQIASDDEEDSTDL